MTAIPPIHPPIIAALVPRAAGKAAAPAQARPHRPGTAARAAGARAWKGVGHEDIATEVGRGAPVRGHGQGAVAGRRAKGSHDITNLATAHRRAGHGSAMAPNARAIRLATSGTGGRPMLPAARIPGLDRARGPASTPHGLPDAAARPAGPRPDVEVA
jgi:hypothetical protein